MENRLSASLGLPLPNQDYHHHLHSQTSNDFHSLFTHFITPNSQSTLTSTQNHIPFFASTTSTTTSPAPNWFSNSRPKTQILMKNLTVFECALIGAGDGGIVGAFTYFCLHPLDTIKTKLQTKGASDIYANAFNAVLKTFQTKGISGFYSGISAVIIGSTGSSGIYFGTCELGKSVLSKLPNYPPVLIPPTVGAMGNILFRDYGPEGAHHVENASQGQRKVVAGAVEDPGKRRRLGSIRRVLCDITEELACGCLKLFFARVFEICGSEQDEANPFGFRMAEMAVMGNDRRCGDGWGEQGAGEGMGFFKFIFLNFCYFIILYKFFKELVG